MNLEVSDSVMCAFNSVSHTSRYFIYYFFQKHMNVVFFSQSKIPHFMAIQKTATTFLDVCKA